MDFLELPKRTAGKRTYGVTSVVDFGTPIGELEHILRDYSRYIDIAKIGIGSAYVTPNLQEKVDLYKKYSIKPYCGGTLFEKCHHQQKVPEYTAFLKRFGIDRIEISNGTLDIPLDERLKLVQELKKDFHVIAEVGSKDGSREMSVSEWENEIRLLLEAGCEYVITEGRDSGTAGIYEKSGSVRAGLIEELLEDLDSKHIIFEAPTPKHQMYFINAVGPNVNLGNVKLQDVLILEAQRQSLRCETFYMEADRECSLLS
ncbi:MAG TPA: phosphosulfolactate synthase [Bacillaceae bacterium]